MASEYKKRKIKSKFLDGSMIKAKGGTRCKYILFYTPAQRKYEKEQVRQELDQAVLDEKEQ